MEPNTPFDPEAIFGILILLIPVGVSLFFWLGSWLLINSIKPKIWRKNLFICLGITMVYFAGSMIWGVTDNNSPAMQTIVLVFLPTAVFSNLYAIIFMIYAIVTRLKHNKQLNKVVD